MGSSKVFVRGALLLMLSIGILAAPLVLTVGGTGNVRAEQPAITASNAIQPPGATSTPGNASAQLVSYKGAPLQAPLTHIVISEFQATGLNGPQDEFVELFNPTAADFPIPAGWALWTSDCNASTAASVYTFGAVTLPAGGHYLIAGSSYSGTATPDVANMALNILDEGGIALRQAATEPTSTIDAVGTCHLGPSDFYETTILAPLTPNSANSYERKFGGSLGSCLDNNDNTTDFVLRATSDPQDAATTPRRCIYPTISGNGVLPGVTLSYLEGLPTPKSITTDASGNYTFQVADGWTGTVTPSLAGYTFTPTNINYSTPVVANTANQNFAAVSLTPATATAAAAATLTAAYTPPGPFAALSVLINEVGWAGTTGGAADQWIELYNTTSSPIDLGAGNGWVLETSNGSLQVNLRGVLASHAYYLLVHDTAASATQSATQAPTQASGQCVVFQRADITYDQAFTGTLSQSGQILYLIDPNGSIEDSADRNGGSWPAGTLSQQRSMERRQGYADTAVGAWGTYGGTGTTSVHDCNGNAVRGTPKLANWVASNPITPSPTATKYKKPTPAIPTPFGHMVINEFLPRAGTDWNQDGKIDVYDEFIELKNLGPIDVDLKNWKLEVEGSAIQTPFTLTGPKLSSGGRVVFYGLTTKLLQEDSGGTVRLLNPSGVVIDARGYGPVADPDQTHCRMPDGYYWTRPCFPTPGLQNALKGTAPAPPPVVSGGPPPCLLADSVPAPFRQAECNPYGAEMWDETYWDKRAGQSQFRVPDAYNKATTIVQ